MNSITKFIKTLWKDESAQGMAEYVLLLVAVVAVAFFFKGKILALIQGKMGEVETGMGSITTGQ